MAGAKWGVGWDEDDDDGDDDDDDGDDKADYDDHQMMMTSKISSYCEPVISGHVNLALYVAELNFQKPFLFVFSSAIKSISIK